MARPTRKRTLRERVGYDRGWLLGQVVVLSLTALAGPLGAATRLGWASPWPRIVDIVAGLILIGAGFAIANKARAELGDSLRVAPTPLEEAALVEHGWYARVRHPLYFAVLLAVLGWGVIWMNAFAFVMLIVVGIFLHFKSRHEEHLLDAAYQGYGDYQQRVRSRFVPKVW